MTSQGKSGEKPLLLEKGAALYWAIKCVHSINYYYTIRGVILLSSFWCWEGGVELAELDLPRLAMLPLCLLAKSFAVAREALRLSAAGSSGGAGTSSTLAAL